MTEIETAARELIETCIKSATLVGNADQVKRGYTILSQYDLPTFFEGWMRSTPTMGGFFDGEMP